MNQATLSRDQAIALVQDWLRHEEEPLYKVPLGVVVDAIAESDDAFAIPWQSQEYLDGDDKAQLLGTSPVIVDRHSGKIMHGRPLVALETQLTDYQRSRGVEG